MFTAFFEIPHYNVFCLALHFLPWVVFPPLLIGLISLTCCRCSCLITWCPPSVCRCHALPPHRPPCLFFSPSLSCSVFSFFFVLVMFCCVFQSSPLCCVPWGVWEFAFYCICDLVSWHFDVFGQHCLCFSYFSCSNRSARWSEPSKSGQIIYLFIYRSMYTAVLTFNDSLTESQQRRKIQKIKDKEEHGYLQRQIEK